MNNYGRKVIYTSYEDITANNVQEIVNKAMQIHESNKTDIKYLIDYEKGKQDILHRKKDVRPEINEKVVENHASQIVNFKLSYVFGSPIRYTQKSEREANEEESVENDDNTVIALNEMCFDEDKYTKDQELAKTFLTCGIAFRGVFPNLDENAYSPFKIVNLDPMSTFIVYGADVYHEPKLAVTYWIEEDSEKHLTITHYTAYTNDKVFEFADRMVGPVAESVNGIGTIPIVEYRNDYERMGCFERVLGLLDAINVCTSDRINGLAQFVQSFLWFHNIDIDDEQFKSLKSAGAFSTSSKDGMEANIKLIESSLNQNEVQTLSDYLYSQLLQICSIPGREAQSGSTTGQSSMLSGGWQEAEEDAHRSELMFSEGEKKFLRVVKNIIERSNSDIKGELKLRDIDIKFSRNKVSNMLVKTQGLLNMQSFGVHPRIALQVCDLFSDPQQTYLDSMPYIEKQWGLNESGSDNSSSNNKDLQQNPRGDNPATVRDTQNEQMGFNNQG